MRSRPNFDFDIIIIGSGAGGASAALSLCLQGFKTCLIERGPKFDPRNDYLQNYHNWELRDDPLNLATRDETCIDTSYQTSITYNNQGYRRGKFIYHRVHGVGGSTLHYQGEAHRFGEHTFSTRSLYGWGVDWPIQYADLEPYYAEIEKLLGVSGESENSEMLNPHKPKPESFPTPAHAFSARSHYLAESAHRAGLTLLPNTLALPTQSIDGRLACQRTGGCDYGCIFSAKSSADVALIPKAQATGNLTLLSNARVTNLHSDNSEITAIKYRQNGEIHQLTAKRYIIATGAIETPRLLLTNASDEHPNGLANPHDQVGRYFMETAQAHISVDLDVDFNVYRGPTLNTRAWDYYIPKEQGITGFVLGEMGHIEHRKGLTQFAHQTPGIGLSHKQLLRRKFGKRVYLFGVTDHLPAASNRVFLSNQKDQDGIQKVSIHSVYSQQDIDTVWEMLRQLKLWARATANATIVNESHSIFAPSATHVAGTCRMGNDPKESVVDAWGKLHVLDNTYITDGSIMPSQGCGDSPSLTIQALALRSAQHIGEKLKSG